MALVNETTQTTRSIVSKPLTFQVQYTPPLVLPVPTIPLAPGNKLPPHVVPADGLPIEAPQYQGMAIGDKIVMKFGTFTSPERTVTSLAPQEFKVPKAQVDAQANSTIEVKYEVTRAAGGSAVPSDVLSLEILQPLVLPVPTIPLAPGNRLTPGVVPANGLPIHVATYQGMAIGDTIIMQFGTHNSSPQRVNALVRQDFTVPKEQVDANANKTIQVRYQVIRAAGGPAVTSAVLSLQVLAVEVCEIFLQYR